MGKKPFLQHDVCIIGAGGTGSYFLKEVSRYIAGLPKEKKKRIRNMYIIDGDYVEKKNLNRQAFMTEDIGRKKAAVMTEVLNEAFGLEYKCIDRYLEKLEDFPVLSDKKEYGYHNIPVLIGCVDNHACPANAPRMIYNSFITYVYNYEAYENEFADYFTSSGLRLENRTLTINPTTFVNECKKYIPSFDFAWFLTNLKILPGASDIYEQYYDYYELYQNRESLTKTQECSIGKVVLGVNMQGVGQEDPENPNPDDPVEPPEGPGIIVEDGGFKIWVPSYSESLKYDGWYFLSNDTLSPLNASDNLTLEQIQTLLDYIATHYRYREECGLTSCAQALYDAQYSYGTSVCGVLAIVIQEGAIGTDKGTHWNYMNWAAASGQPTVDGRFRDFTSFGSPNAAMAAQLELMHRNWFEKGQTNYFEFIWHNYDYQNLSTITHSFCPCWDDSSFPWNRVDNPGIYVGWPNKCADYRNLLKSLL